MSIDCLLHHPMAVALDYTPDADLSDVSWSCRVDVPDSQLYQYERKPRSARRQGCPLSDPDIWILATRWLERRGVSVHCTNVGMLQPPRRRMWVADIAGERRGKLVIAATYYTRRRKGRAREHMRAYATALGEVCRLHYRIKGAVMALVNVYGDGRAEGEFLDPPGGADPGPSALRSPPALPARRRGRRFEGEVQQPLEEASVRGVLPPEGDVPVEQDDSQPLVEQGERGPVAEAREVQGGHAEAQEGLGAEPGAPPRLAGQVERDRGLDAAHVLDGDGGQARELGPLDAEGRVGTHAALEDGVHIR
jgi:hypothetical protein